MTASLLETTASITNEKRTQRRRIENISMMDYLHKTQWSAAACEHSIWQRQRLVSAPVTCEKQWNRLGWLMSLNRALRGRRVEGGCWGSVGAGRKDEQTPNHKEARRRRNLKKWLVGVGIRHDVEPNRLPARGRRRSEFMTNKVLGLLTLFSLAVGLCWLKPVWSPCPQAKNEQNLHPLFRHWG